MLFLILNHMNLDPYIDRNEAIIPPIYAMNHYNIGNEYENYSELYKELVHTNRLNDIFYIIGSMCSLIAIYYLSKEINKSIYHVA